MRKVLLTVISVAGLFYMAAGPQTIAADSKVVTITGEGKCAKCALKQSDECQNVIQTKDQSGNTVNYYVVQNDVAKKFHKNICREGKKVTATGTVQDVGGKKELTATKIQVAQ